uniref:F-box domain-containing protein n=1 Tax=Steinernema glaseri TaxID=37863 RepID=A0A1I7YE34_9BILA
MISMNLVVFCELSLVYLKCKVNLMWKMPRLQDLSSNTSCIDEDRSEIWLGYTEGINRSRTSHRTMDDVPALFIKSVLCLSSLPTVEPVKKLSSHSWSQMAADQMARRKNWILLIKHCEGSFSGIFENKSVHPFTATLQEFARKDPTVHQITQIALLKSENLTWRNCGPTKVGARKDIESFERRIFPRINYSALEHLQLSTMDSIGLHSAILRHLVDKNMKIKRLYLKYEGPNSTEILEQIVRKKVVTIMSLSGEWPPESTVPLIEALVPQRQLRKFWSHARMSFSESFFESLVADWREDNSRQAEEMFFWSPETTPPLDQTHPNSKDRLNVEYGYLANILPMSP